MYDVGMGQSSYRTASENQSSDAGLQDETSDAVTGNKSAGSGGSGGFAGFP